MSTTDNPRTAPPNRVTLDEGVRSRVAEALQSTLVDLIELALAGKQAHWNVTGPYFRPLHEQLDEFVAEQRLWSDTVAERMTAIGVAPDGRVQRVAGDSMVDPMSETWLTAGDVQAAIGERLERAAQRCRDGIEVAGELDPGSEDVLIEVLRGLEEQLWMLTVQGHRS